MSTIFYKDGRLYTDFSFVVNSGKYRADPFRKVFVTNGPKTGVWIICAYNPRSNVDQFIDQFFYGKHVGETVPGDYVLVKYTGFKRDGVDVADELYVSEMNDNARTLIKIDVSSESFFYGNNALAYKVLIEMDVEPCQINEVLKSRSLWVHSLISMKVYCFDISKLKVMIEAEKAESGFWNKLKKCLGFKQK